MILNMTNKIFKSYLTTMAVLVTVISSCKPISYQTKFITIDQNVTDIIIPKSQKIVTLSTSNKTSEESGDFLYRIQRMPVNSSVKIGSKKNGLCYLYYQGNWTMLPNFERLDVIKSGEIEQPNIAIADRNDGIAFQFYGYIKINKTGLYDFYIQSDDGGKVYIDNNLVVSNDGIHPIQESKGKIVLEKGLHSITVKFFENYGGEFLLVYYSGPDLLKRIIPDSAFYIPTSWKCSDNKRNLVENNNESKDFE